MAQSPDWNQLLETGKQFGTMTRQEAERRVRELIRRGEIAQERFQTAVDELLERSRGAADDLIVRGRQGAEDIRELVRTELRRQVKALGLVTRDDLARFAARIGVGRAPAKKSADGQRAPAKKAPAKKATGAKKAGGAKKVTAAAKVAKPAKTTAKKATGVKKAGGVKKATGAKKTSVKKATGAKKTAVKQTTVKKTAPRSSPPGGSS
jgi:polyhydroxyalkanoate synthesis regulator phasin